jgi:hypothetical protein
MPFDGTDSIHADAIIKRRTDAAVLLRSIPKSQFDMTYWLTGRTACALGWLALDSKHDDWGWGFNHRPVWSGIFPRSTFSDQTYQSAAKYFGIPLKTAKRMFSRSISTRLLYRKFRIANITAEDVIGKLSKHPIV